MTKAKKNTTPTQQGPTPQTSVPSTVTRKKTVSNPLNTKDVESEEDNEVANMTTAAVRGDSPLPELPEVEDGDLPVTSLPELTEEVPNVNTPPSSRDMSGRQYVRKLVEDSVPSKILRGRFADSINELIEGIGSLQNDIEKIATNQENTVRRVIGVLKQMDNPELVAPSTSSEEDANENSVKNHHGPSSATRLSNAGLGPEPNPRKNLTLRFEPTTHSGERRDDSASFRADYDSGRTREEPPHMHKSKTPTSYSGSNPPSNYYISNVERGLSTKSSEIDEESDPGTAWIRKMISDRVEKVFPELSAFKSLKLEQPEKYEGKDDLEHFESWLSRTCRWMRLAGLTGPNLDSERIIVLGQILSGQALVWYNSVIDSPDRIETVWTFQTAVTALYTRFVHRSNVLTATEKFESVQYTRAGGAAQLANDLTRYAKKMVEIPDPYTIRRRFWGALPYEITDNLGKSRALSAEETSLNELVRNAVQFEEAIRRDNISRRMKLRGSIGTSTLSTSPHSTYKITNPKPKFGPKGDERRDDRGRTEVRNSSSTASKPSERKTINEPHTHKKGSTSSSSISCYRCNGPHLASNKICELHPSKTGASVRMMTEVEEAEIEREEAEGQDEDGPLEGSQYEGSEDQFPEELDKDYSDGEGDQAWMGGMRLFSMRETPRPTRALGEEFRSMSGIPQGNSEAESDREVRTLINMLDEVQRRNAELRRRLTEAESENTMLFRHNRLWRDQAGETNVDLNEFCEAVLNGHDQDQLIQRVEYIYERQRRRFRQREDVLSRITYRDEDEDSETESSDGEMPELISSPGAEQRLPPVGDWVAEDNEEPVYSEFLRAMGPERDREYRSAILPKEERPERDFKCMTTYVELNGVKGLALLDSGSSIDCVSPDFARVAGIHARPLAKPIGLQLGCVGSRSTINFGARCDLSIAGRKDSVYLDVVNVDHYDLVLGVPFLQQFGVKLNFEGDVIQIGKTEISSIKAPKPSSIKGRRAFTGTSAKYQWAPEKKLKQE